MNALPSTERLQAPAAPLPRIVGLDVARGLAVIGMLAQHFASLPPSPPTLFRPGSWAGLVSGGSTILFAVIGGISIGIITGAARRLDGQQLLRARMKLLARAAVIFLLGAVLNAISPGVGVILCVYALCYIAVIPLLRVRPRTLALGAVAGMVVVPVLLAYLAAFKQWRLPVNASFEEFDLLFAPNGLSVAPLTLYFLLGIALSRFDISSARTVLGMLVGGVVLVVVGYGGGWVVTEAAGTGTAAAVPPAPAGGPATAPPDNAALTRGLLCMPEPGQVTCIDPAFDPDTYKPAWQAPDLADQARRVPHSNHVAEMLGGTGVALLVTGLSLVVTPRVRRLAVPLAALGTMALTAYSLQFVLLYTVSYLGGSDLLSDNQSFLIMTVALLVVCPVWRRLLGQGPFERLLSAAARRAAQVG
ncbi:DUF418 domain-containing protein [Streptomyces sp. NPDC006132]|uniref:DUF418 domain-containing protein n=1 Tax=Streptomyces sp. NPDC006132 TaxID=3156732 RepID=UPI00340201FF